MTTTQQGAPNGAPATEPNNGHVYNIAMLAAILSLSPQTEDPIAEAMGLVGDVRIRLRETMAAKQAAKQAPGGKAAPAPAPNAAPQQQQQQQQQEQPQERECPKCGGRMWDNRASKRNPKAPDFKCRDKSCDGVIWPPREQQSDSPKRGNARQKVQDGPISAGAPGFLDGEFDEEDADLRRHIGD